MEKEKTSLLSGGGLLVISLMISNFSNFIFNAFLGRTLSFEEFGFITLYNTLWLLLLIVLNGLSATVNHTVASVFPVSQSSAKLFYNRLTQKALLFGALGASTWLVLLPLIATFFKVRDWVTLIYFVPMIVVGLYSVMGRGYLQGLLRFTNIAVLVLVESISKLVIAAGFVFFGFKHFTYLSIPLSIVCAFVVTLWFIKRVKIVNDENPVVERFPKRFFVAAIITGLSSTAFLSVDILLAKHFLNERMAGEYAVLSLVGKMIYFFGSLLNTFMISLISSAEGRKRNPKLVFYSLFAGTAFLVLCGFVALGPLGHIFVPLLLGEKTRVILPYLTLYTLAISLFTLANTIIIYRLSRKQYKFSFISLFVTGLMIIAIIFNHRNVRDITFDVFISSFAGFFLVALFNFLYDSGRFVLRNLVDFFDLFYPLQQQESIGKGKKRVLIFNWRDTKHKYAGGAEVYVHELAKRLVSEGNYVTQFCGNDSMSSRYEVIDGVEVIRRGGFYFVYVWAFFYYMLKFRRRYDVIIDCQNGIPFFTSLYSRERVFCLVFHIHQEVFRKYLPGPLALLAENLEKNVMPFAYKNATYLTISESTKKDMEMIGLSENEIKIIYPGANLEELKPANKEEKPTILYLGRLKSYKSVDVLINAFEKVLDTVPEARLVIAGSGEEESSLRKLVRELGMDEKVEFLGKVTEAAKVSLMQKAWVFVNPSYMEGWGITTIEANACGTPVVASDVPGLRDSVRNPHSGYLVEYGNPDAFADKILKIITNTSHRKELSENSVEWAKRFSWDASAKRLIEVL
jgi:glycosyltransferase involved in cell wall biosynthesis/O-antigen/teichoic acid export membrane protein